MSDVLPSGQNATPVVVSREAVFTTPYCTLVAKRLAGQSGDPYYSLAVADYVTVVAVTSANQCVLVRQFRPAVETLTLELPAGLVDPGHTPEQAARTELIEETGFEPGTLELIGCLRPDTGRLGNRMWVYFAGGLTARIGHTKEAGIDVVLLPIAELADQLADGRFDHALHVAALMLAVQAGCLVLPVKVR